MPRRGLACCGSGLRWWCDGVVAMSVIFLAITPQLELAFLFFLISMRRLRRSGKSCFPLAFIGFIEGMRENGYEGMPPVEEPLASYLSVGETSSLKAPSLPSKPLQETSHLNGRAYAAAGQAVTSLHTMAVLQAYHTDLLKDLDKGQGLSPDEVAELRRTMDFNGETTVGHLTFIYGTDLMCRNHGWVSTIHI